MDERTIRENIIRACEKHGFTKKAIADAVGISKVSLHALEKGPTRILNENIYKIADFLGLSVEELILGYKPDPESAGRLQQMKMDYGEKSKSLVAGYEERLGASARENNALQALVESQKETIRNQEEIISMLRRRIPEEND
ncbi:MAG: helix-turn-helix transcriptional regulator [Bacteroidales bacterium]|nr:helix-turn-helix transcriptional regulator [Bacteroidales bacterium]